MQAQSHRPAPTSTNFKRLERRLQRLAGKAIADYGMIEHGDRVLVCLSGGKDSYTLLDILRALRLRAPVDFELIAMNLDQRQPGFPEDVLPGYLQKIGVEYRIVSEDTYSIVQQKIAPGKTTCSLCSRLRRGIIYRTARELGVSKIALGHHRDDIVETFFLNLFFGARLKAMPPKLVSDDGEHVVIRPLAYCAETDIARYARGRAYPIIPCNLCGAQENLQRREIKRMLAAWRQDYPDRDEIIFRSLRKAVPSHLLDPALFDFAAAGASPSRGDGDRVFDPPDLACAGVAAGPRR